MVQAAVRNYRQRQSPMAIASWLVTRTIYAAFSMLPSAGRERWVAVGGYASRSTRGGGMVRLGLRTIPFGVAAVTLGVFLKSVGTQAGQADIGLLSPAISVFGTVHPAIFRFHAPLGSGPPINRFQLASLDPQVGLDAPVAADSFDDRFRSAMPVLASGVRSQADRDAQRADASKPMIVIRAGLSAGQAREEVQPPGDDGRTAIYDITAHTVYLPDGRRLEAHSGLGGLKDDPGHVHLRMRGATPPNVYNLTLRERIFHGVRAIRLNPVDEARMHGRGGILAHTYMLGSDGQSNGCVAFRDYPQFLNAFRNGEVARLAVVDRLESPPGRLAAGQLPEPVRELMKATDRSRQYAAASDQ
jgi:hypothetical protein